MLELDVPVDDLLLLESLPGAVDHLVADLYDAAQASAEVSVTVVTRHRDAVLVRWVGPLRPLHGIRFYSSCAVWWHDSLPGIDVAGEVEEWAGPSRGRGVLGLLEGPVRFRVAADLGEARWPLRAHLEQAWGWVNDPGDWQVNLRLTDHGLLCEVGALHQTMRFGRLARIPASTTPVVSAVLSRLLKPEPGGVVLDPFCGAGTNLLTAYAGQPGARLLGTDTQPRALAAARENLAGLPGGWALVRADAARLPVAAGSVDRVVANLPFGKRVGSHGVNEALYPAFTRQLARVLTRQGRAVLLTDDKRILVDAVQRTADIRIIKEVQLETGGLHPTAYVVTRGRSRRRKS